MKHIKKTAQLKHNKTNNQKLLSIGFYKLKNSILNKTKTCSQFKINFMVSLRTIRSKFSEIETHRKYQSTNIDKKTYHHF